MDSRKRHSLHFVALGVATLALGLSVLWPWGRPVQANPERKGRHRIDGEHAVALHLVQPYPGGIVTLEQMWYHEGKPDLLRILANFVGDDPRERFYVSSRVREEKDGFESGGPSWFVDLAAPPEGSLFMLENSRFPASAEMLFVRLYFVSKATRKLAPTVDFEIKNPLHRTPEPWPAEPLPATRVAGPLKIELLKMETGFAEPRADFPEGRSRLVLRVLEDGASVRNWRLTESLLSTGSGVQMRDGAPPSSAPREGVIEVHSSTLWKCEGTWKAHFAFEREDAVAPGEFIEMKELPVPAVGEVAESDRHWQAGGMEVRLLGLSGGGTNALTQRRGSPAAEVAVCFQFSGAQPQGRLRVLSMTDETGMELYSQDEGGRRFDISLGEPLAIWLPAGIRPKKLSFKIAVMAFERIETEFLAKPTFLNQRFVAPSSRIGPTSFFR